MKDRYCEATPALHPRLARTRESKVAGVRAADQAKPRKAPGQAVFPIEPLAKNRPDGLHNAHTDALDRTPVCANGSGTFSRSLWHHAGLCAHHGA